MISIAIYRVNLHQLIHLPKLVRLIGAPFYYKVNCMEADIGFYKKKVATTTKDVGICMGNILEKRMLFDFLQVNNIIDFDHFFTKPVDPHSFFDNPEDPELGQLWSPFLNRRFHFETELKLALQNEPIRKIGGYIASTFFMSIHQYMLRSLGPYAPKTFEKFHHNQTICLSKRLFYNNHAYISASNKNQSRGGNFIKVRSEQSNQ
jgi:hypothetical protein